MNTIPYFLAGLVQPHRLKHSMLSAWARQNAMHISHTYK